MSLQTWFLFRRLFFSHNWMLVKLDAGKRLSVMIPGNIAKTIVFGISGGIKVAQIVNLW
jgi:hypothetical protein